MDSTSTTMNSSAFPSFPSFPSFPVFPSTSNTTQSNNLATNSTSNNNPQTTNQTATISTTTNNSTNSSTSTNSSSILTSNILGNASTPSANSLTSPPSVVVNQSTTIQPSSSNHPIVPITTNQSTRNVNFSQPLSTKGVIPFRSRDVHVFRFPGTHQIRLDIVDNYISRLYVTDANGNEERQMVDSVKLYITSSGEIVQPQGNSYYMSAFNDYTVTVDGNDAMNFISNANHIFQTASHISYAFMPLA